MPQATHIEQFDGLRLHTFGRVNHHQPRIHGGQHAIRILGKVLVTGRIEQIDKMVFVLELHDRGRDRNAALLLNLHPVGGGEFTALFAFDRTRLQNRAGEQQEFFRERGFPRVGVGNDGESAAMLDFVANLVQISRHNRSANAQVAKNRHFT